MGAGGAPVPVGLQLRAGAGEPQLRPVRPMVTAPPCGGVAAGGGTGAALPQWPWKGRREPERWPTEGGGGGCPKEWRAAPAGG